MQIKVRHIANTEASPLIDVELVDLNSVLTFLQARPVFDEATDTTVTFQSMQVVIPDDASDAFLELIYGP